MFMNLVSITTVLSLESVSKLTDIQETITVVDTDVSGEDADTEDHLTDPQH